MLALTPAIRPACTSGNDKPLPVKADGTVSPRIILVGENKNFARIGISGHFAIDQGSPILHHGIGSNGETGARQAAYGGGSGKHVPAGAKRDGTQCARYETSVKNVIAETAARRGLAVGKRNISGH